MATLINPMSDQNTIPAPIIATVSDVLSVFYTHREIDTRFPEMGFPGESSQNAGNKTEKIRIWLMRVNKEIPEQAFSLLGKALEELMENEYDEILQGNLDIPKKRERINKILERFSFRYEQGGRISGSSVLSTPTKSLEDILRGRDFPSIELEFQRAVDNCEKDPETAATAACAILESFCKVYIETEGLDMPANQSLIDLWPPVKKHLRMDPALYGGSDELKAMIQGLGTTIHAIACLRTVKGSAHGRGKVVHRLDPRHARLAVGAAHTITTFLLEAWGTRLSDGKEQGYIDVFDNNAPF